MTKRKLDDYLYEMEYNFIDYSLAYKYYKENTQSILGGCTSFRLGNYFGRNYDWLYDESVSFVIRTNNVIGIAGNIPELTRQFVESGVDSELYDILPFALLDGINKHGLVVSMNVVPLDYGSNISKPLKELRHTICGKMIPRFLLDNFTNAIDAVNYLQDYCSIYCTKQLKEKGYELHYIISDIYNNCFVIELINGKLNILKHNIITNFHISNVQFNKNGTVYTPSTQTEFDSAMTTNGVTKYGCGLERYNLVAQFTKRDYNSIVQLLKDLRYSNTYRNLNWFTEFVGNNMTVNSSVREYIEHLAPILDELEYKSRTDSKLWQTVHSSLYNIPNRELELRVQENFDKCWRFKI